MPCAGEYLTDAFDAEPDRGFPRVKGGMMRYLHTLCSELGYIMIEPRYSQVKYAWKGRKTWGEQTTISTVVPLTAES